MKAVSTALALLPVVSAAATTDRLIVGLTAAGTVIEAAAVRAKSPRAPTVLVVGGLDGASSRFVLEETSAMRAVPPARRRFHLLAIAAANPDGARLKFPPAGPAYASDPTSHYLWRWIGTQAPDLVLIANADDFGLAEALAANTVAGMGSIPARVVEPRTGLLRSLAPPGASAARRELESRLSRSPVDLARELERYYGHAFDQAVYIPGMALIGRMRLGFVDDVQRIVAPFIGGGKDSLERATGSHLAGHLVFGELAERTRDGRYVALVRKAADLAFTETGEPKDAMPMHNEMSDAVFMSCPILAKAGKLTGERKYFDMAQRHFRYMQKLCLRPDGLYRHSPLSEAAWGRGNAFPALGLALTLSDLPRDHAGFREMVQALRGHLAALSQFQDENGMWRQVVDKPGAYPEFSATAMIGTAMLRAMRKGWIDARTYRPRIDAAWRAVLARTRDGRVMDVCESTGKQKSVQSYLDRVAIVGEDPRGGGMALVFATEMAGLQ